MRKTALFALALAALLGGVAKAGPLPKPVWAFLDDSVACDGTGNTNANGDYSASVEVFCYAPEAGTAIRMDRLEVYVEDVGMVYGQGYGAVSASALTNGITVQIYDSSGNLAADFTGGFPVKNNAQWGRMGNGSTGASSAIVGGNVAVYGGSGASDLGAYSVGIDLGINGMPVRLRSGWELRVNLNDDFSFLDQHRFRLVGQSEDANW